MAQTTPNEPQTSNFINSNLKLHQPKPELHILNRNNQTKNFVEDDKHNPQAKMHVLNWHNQNPNIPTAEMLKVFV